MLNIVALLESVYAAAGINELLLAGIEGMALGADFNTKLFLGGSAFEGLAAQATNGCYLIFGMDLFFHRKFHLSGRKV